MYWFAEGFAEYYAYRAMHAQGMMDTEALLASIPELHGEPTRLNAIRGTVPPISYRLSVAFLASRMEPLWALSTAFVCQPPVVDRA